MKTLGIIGGMSPESTVTYYRLINQLINQAKSGNHSAPLVMVNVEFEQIVCLQKQGEWHKAGEILATAAKKIDTNRCRRDFISHQYYAQSCTTNY